MRIERKRAGRTLPLTWRHGPIGPMKFDGYELVIHLSPEDGSDVRVVLERHEATALLQFIDGELEKQRERVRALMRAQGELTKKTEPENA